MAIITLSPVDSSARRLILAHFDASLLAGRLASFAVNPDGTVDVQDPARYVIADLKRMGLVEVVAR